MSRVLSSRYMEWAKTRSRARFNLAASGLCNYRLSDLPVSLEDLELSGPSFYGYEPLQGAIASKCGVDHDCVVAATGASMANHLVMAAVIEPGDEVLIETPTYELLVSTALYLGAEVKRFHRRLERAFRIDLETIAQAVTTRTRLIVLTNLHNPSGVLTGRETLKQVGEIAQSAGARVLVDEVYLDAAFEDSPGSAFHLGGEFVVTSSLTKVYGLSGLRCGWVLAEPDLASRIWKLNDLFGVIAAHPAERLSVVALAHLDRIASRARALLDANRVVLDRFFASRNDLRVIRPQFGTIAFPELVNKSVEMFCELLRERYETTVVPGSFFELADHFRIGIGCEPEILGEGLERIASALDDLGG